MFVFAAIFAVEAVAGLSARAVHRPGCGFNGPRQGAGGLLLAADFLCEGLLVLRLCFCSVSVSSYPPRQPFRFLCGWLGVLLGTDGGRLCLAPLRLAERIERQERLKRPCTARKLGRWTAHRLCDCVLREAKRSRARERAALPRRRPSG